MAQYPAGQAAGREQGKEGKKRIGRKEGKKERRKTKSKKKTRRIECSQVWQLVPVVETLRSLRKEDHLG